VSLLAGMATEREIRRRIADIDAALAAGAKTVTLDGVTVTLDHAAMAAERRRLEQQLPETRRKRPRAFGVNFNG
jgi:hypothetical protein